MLRKTHTRGGRGEQEGHAGAAGVGRGKSGAWRDVRSSTKPLKAYPCFPPSSSGPSSPPHRPGSHSSRRPSRLWQSAGKHVSRCRRSSTPPSCSPRPSRECVFRSTAYPRTILVSNGVVRGGRSCWLGCGMRDAADSPAAWEAFWSGGTLVGLWRRPAPRQHRLRGAAPVHGVPRPAGGDRRR